MGEFELTLGENTLTLRCTPLALRSVETKHGGIRVVTQQLYDVNFQLIKDLIEAGLQGGQTYDKKLLEQEIFDAGVMNLVEPMMEYLMLLGNGGKPPSEEGEPEEGEA